jgi:sulfate adenylyltransferase subunit 1
MLTAGDEVIVLPAGRRCRVEQIQVLDESRPLAVAGDSVTLRLADDVDVSRGDVIADARRPARVARSLRARLCWLGADPFDESRRLILKHGTRSVRALVSEIHHSLDVHTLDEHPASAIAMNDIAQVSITLAQPVAFDAYDANRATGSFILIDATTHHTVAAGMIDG